MSKIACVWADEVEDAAVNEWYQNTNIHQTAGRLNSRAYNAHPAEDNMFKEVPGIDGESMTVYELPEKSNAKELDTQICPPLERLPSDAKLETRIYSEYASYFGEDWQGDVRDVHMWIVVRWQPADAMHDEFVDWFRSEFTPGMLESPELLRTRIFKLENASAVTGQKHEQKSTQGMYQYLTFWEFNCHELPWEILVYLGSSERWRFYVEGGHLNWQICQYLVNWSEPQIRIDSPMPDQLSETPSSDSKPADGAPCPPTAREPAVEPTDSPSHSPHPQGLESTAAAAHVSSPALDRTGPLTRYFVRLWNTVQKCLN